MTKNVDLRPTRSMIAAAKRGLALVAAGRAGDGLQPETVAWARKVAQGQPLTPEKVRLMRAWLARHASDRRAGWDKHGQETPGFVAWLLWFDSGRGEGQQWAERKVAELDRQEQQPKKVKITRKNKP